MYKCVTGRLTRIGQQEAGERLRALTLEESTLIPFDSIHEKVESIDFVQHSFIVLCNILLDTNELAMASNKKTL